MWQKWIKINAKLTRSSSLRPCYRKNLKVDKNDLYSDLFKIPRGLRNLSKCVYTMVKSIIVSQLSIFDKNCAFVIARKRKLKLNENTWQHFPVADLSGGNNFKSEGANLLFSQYFPANCMKMKEIGLGPRIPGVPPPSPYTPLFLGLTMVLR